MAKWKRRVLWAVAAAPVLLGTHGCSGIPPATGATYEDDSYEMYRGHVETDDLGGVEFAGLTFKKKGDAPAASPALGRRVVKVWRDANDDNVIDEGEDVLVDVDLDTPTNEFSVGAGTLGPGEGELKVVIKVWDAEGDKIFGAEEDLPGEQE
ncbi:MAG: hypothetical protein P1V81_16655 [Planctomycetota bacterium]|nr:hypothetical protein [Planctomycetota bacterium]